MAFRDVDFLKLNRELQTLDVLFNLGLMTVIVKATRLTDHTLSVTDHICTNTPEKVIQSGICSINFSDYLQVFLRWSVHYLLP